MNMRTLPRLLEPDDLLRYSGDRRLELIDGVPVEKAMGAESDEIGVALASLLRAYCLANNLGRVYGSETGYVCFPGRPKLVRKPDVSFVPAGRLPGGRTPKGYFAVAPDLAVEVISPDDRYARIEEKVQQFRSAGTRLFWIITPETKTVLIRRLDGTCEEVGETGTLSGEDVVPGFTCKVADLFV